MHAIATRSEILLELLFLLRSSSVLLEYHNHFIISIFCVNCTFATHHFHNLVIANSVLRLVQSCIPSQTSSRIILIFRLQDGHWCGVRHNLLLASLRCQALPYELLLRINIRVSRRSSIGPLLFISMSMSSRLRVFVRVNWLFSYVSRRLFKLLARACIWTFLSLNFSHFRILVHLHIFGRASWSSRVVIKSLWGLFIGYIGVLSLCSCSWIRCSSIVEVIDNVCNIGNFVSIMMMEVIMLLLWLPIAFLGHFRYLLIFSFLIFLSSRLIQYVTAIIAAAMLHSRYGRLIEILRIAWLLRIYMELVSSGCIRRLRHSGSVHGLLLPSLLRLLPLFFRHEMPFIKKTAR